MAHFDKADTSNKVIEVIAQKLKIDKNTITPISTLQDLGADSLDLVEIVMKLEEVFGIEINDADAEKLHNVNDVVEYVQTLRTK
jgi:acyl carrier protein